MQSSSPDPPWLDSIPAEDLSRLECSLRVGEARPGPADLPGAGAHPALVRDEAVVRGDEDSFGGAEIDTLDGENGGAGGDCEERGLPPVEHGGVLLLQDTVQVNLHHVVAGGGEDCWRNGGLGSSGGRDKSSSGHWSSCGCRSSGCCRSGCCGSSGSCHGGSLAGHVLGPVTYLYLRVVDETGGAAVMEAQTSLTLAEVRGAGTLRGWAQLYY